MAETRVGLVLVGRVLGVVHQEIGVAAPVGEVLQRPVGSVGEQRDLVVGRKRETRGALVDAVTESRDRMHQEMRRDAQRADLERLAWVPLDELHLGRHVAQPHRKVGRVSLVRERGLQRFRRTRRSDDRQMSPRHERRQKEWKALDVVEVRVGDQEMGLQRLGRTERASELGNART